MTRNKEIVIKSEINVVMGTCLNNIGTVNILFGIELSLEPSNSSQNGMSAQISSRGRDRFSSSGVFGWRSREFVGLDQASVGRPDFGRLRPNLLVEMTSFLLCL